MSKTPQDDALYNVEPSTESLMLDGESWTTADPIIYVQDGTSELTLIVKNCTFTNTLWPLYCGDRPVRLTWQNNNVTINSQSHSQGIYLPYETDYALIEDSTFNDCFQNSIRLGQLHVTDSYKDINNVTIRNNTINNTWGRQDATDSENSAHN